MLHNLREVRGRCPKRNRPIPPIRSGVLRPTRDLTRSADREDSDASGAACTRRRGPPLHVTTRRRFRLRRCGSVPARDKSNSSQNWIKNHVQDPGSHDHAHNHHQHGHVFRERVTAESRAETDEGQCSCQATRRSRQARRPTFGSGETDAPQPLAIRYWRPRVRLRTLQGAVATRSRPHVYAADPLSPHLRLEALDAPPPHSRHPSRSFHQTPHRHTARRPARPHGEAMKVRLNSIVQTNGAALSVRAGQFFKMGRH